MPVKEIKTVVIFQDISDNATYRIESIFKKNAKISIHKYQGSSHNGLNINAENLLYTIMSTLDTEISEPGKLSTVSEVAISGQSVYEAPHKGGLIKITGIMKPTTHRFAGKVTIDKFPTPHQSLSFERYIVYSSPFNDIYGFKLTGVCNKETYDDNGRLSERQLGIIKDNNKFIISMCYFFDTKGDFAFCQFLWQKANTPQEVEQLSKNIALFTDYFRDEISNAISNKLLHPNQLEDIQQLPPLSVNDEFNLSHDKLLILIADNKVKYDGRSLNKGLHKLWDSASGRVVSCVGLQEKTTFFLPTKTKQYHNYFERNYIEFDDDKKTTSEKLMRYEFSKEPNMPPPKVQTHYLQQNASNSEQYRYVQWVFPRNAHMRATTKIVSYSDGSAENKLGYIQYQTDDCPSFSQIEFLKKILKVNKITVTYLNGGVRFVQIITEDGLCEEIKLLDSSDDTELCKHFDFEGSQRVVYRLLQKIDSRFEELVLSRSRKMSSGFNYRYEDMHQIRGHLVKHQFSGFIKDEMAADLAQASRKFFRVNADGEMEHVDTDFVQQADKAASASSTAVGSELEPISVKKPENIVHLLLSFGQFSEADDASACNDASAHTSDEAKSKDLTPGVNIYVRQCLPVFPVYQPVFPEQLLRRKEPLSQLIQQLFHINCFSKISSVSETYIDKTLGVDDFCEDYQQKSVSSFFPPQVISRAKSMIFNQQILQRLTKPSVGTIAKSDLLALKVIDDERIQKAIDFSFTINNNRASYSQPAPFVQMLREAVINKGNGQYEFPLNFSNLLLILRTISYIDVRLHLKKGLVTSHLKAMHLFKSDDFILYLLKMMAKGINTISLNRDIPKVKRDIEYNIALVIRHLITMPDVTISFIEYLKQIEDKLYCFPRSETNCIYFKQTQTFEALFATHPLFEQFRNALAEIKLEELSIESLLMLSLIMGHLSHGSMPAKQISNKYSDENHFRQLIRFRNNTYHGGTLTDTYDDLYHVTQDTEQLANMFSEQHQAENSAPGRRQFNF